MLAGASLGRASCASPHALHAGKNGGEHTTRSLPTQLRQMEAESLGCWARGVTLRMPPWQEFHLPFLCLPEISGTFSPRV